MVTGSMTYKCISIEHAKELIDEGDATIIDIRDPESYAKGHIENSIHVSNSNVGEIVAQTDKSKPLVIYCYHGNSSKSAAEYFFNMGFVKSYSVDGGYEHWKFQL